MNINEYYVPQTYLKKFVDGKNKLLDRFDVKNLKLERNKSVKHHLCCENDFYEMMCRLSDEEFKHIEKFIEDKLSHIETKYGRFYKRLIKETNDKNNGEQILLTDEDVEFIKEFAVLQAVRTKRAFDIISLVYKENVGFDLDKLGKYDRNTILVCAAFPKDIYENKNVEYSLYDGLLDMINNKYCTITFRRASSGRFLTSDNPSVLSFDKDGVSLTLPINDHLLILIVYSPNENLENYNLKCFDIDQDKIDGFNKIIICGAWRYIFGENILEQEVDFIKESIKEYNDAE